MRTERQHPSTLRRAMAAYRTAGRPSRLANQTVGGDNDRAENPIGVGMRPSGRTGTGRGADASETRSGRTSGGQVIVVCAGRWAVTARPYCDGGLEDDAADEFEPCRPTDPVAGLVRVDGATLAVVVDGASESRRCCLPGSTSSSRTVTRRGMGERAEALPGTWSAPSGECCASPATPSGPGSHRLDRTQYPGSGTSAVEPMRNGAVESVGARMALRGIGCPSP